MFPLSMLKLLLPEQLIQRLIQGLTDSKAEAEGWIVFPCLNQANGLACHPDGICKDPLGHIMFDPGHFNLRFFRHMIFLSCFIALLYTIFSILQYISYIL